MDMIRFKVVLIIFGLIITSCKGWVESNKIKMTDSLFERMDINVGTSTNTVLPLYLDDDNYLDLLVVGNDQVIILHGEGDGQFNVFGYVPAGENAVDLASADIDEDGFTDLAVANHDTKYITLLFGNSNGSFESRSYSQMIVNVSPHPHMVKLYDLNGDEHVDLLVDDRNAEALRLFPGSGDGGFGNPNQIPVGGDPYRGISLFDVNNDGNIDIVSPNPDRVEILTGNGSGVFTQFTTLYPGFAPFSASAGDFNGDGIMDITAASGEGAGGLAVWFGNSDSSFGEKVNYELASGPTRLATGDLTNDGKDEIVVTSYIGGEIAILVAGEKSQLERIALGGYPYGVATGDFNNDDLVDIAVANDGTNFVTVLFSNDNSTGINKNPSLINDYSLYQNYPNPFNPSTQITYSLKNYKRVTIKVFDILGNEIVTLIDKLKEPGTYKLIFSAAELPNGVYFYQLKAGDFWETKKMILIK